MLFWLTGTNQKFLSTRQVAIAVNIYIYKQIFRLSWFIFAKLVIWSILTFWFEFKKKKKSGFNTTIAIETIKFWCSCAPLNKIETLECEQKGQKHDCPCLLKQTQHSHSHLKFLKYQPKGESKMVLLAFPSICIKPFHWTHFLISSYLFWPNQKKEKEKKRSYLFWPNPPPSL